MLVNFNYLKLLAKHTLNNLFSIYVLELNQPPEAEEEAARWPAPSERCEHRWVIFTYPTSCENFFKYFLVITLLY